MKLIATSIILAGALALAQTNSPQPNPDKGPLQAKDIKLLPFVPTYHKDVRPIIEKSCTNCHTDGGIAPFSLENPQNAIENARAIQLMTMSRQMPPWHATGESPAMRDDPRLTKEEIETIANWAWAGAPLGNEKDYQPIEKTVETRKPDLIVDIGTNYQPKSDLTDDYRCFLIDPKLNEDKFVTAYNFIPSNKSIVHHVILFQISGDLVKQANSINGKDRKPGWQCFGGTGLQNDQVRTQDDESVTAVGSWVPGSGAVKLPEGTGLRMKPGSMLVMQLHYNLLAGNGEDNTSAQLFFAPKGQNLKPLKTMGLISEVEIPCPGSYPTDINDKCNRNFAYSQSHSFNPQVIKALKNGILSLACGSDLKTITFGGPANNVISKCSWPVQQNAILMGIQPHMHLLGKAIKVELNTKSTSIHKVLIDVPSYDFHWQRGYWYQEPIVINKGDTLTISCTYDNSSENQAVINDQLQEPRYVIWGEGSTDEMCLAGLYVINQ